MKDDSHAFRTICVELQPRRSRRAIGAVWTGAVGFHFEPLAAHVLARIREGERIFADETTLPTLDPGGGKAKTAWLWAYA